MFRPRWLINNPVLKLIALLLAVSCWFYIVWGLGMEERYQQKIVKGVEIKVLEPAASELLATHKVPYELKITPEKIDLIVGGPQRQLAKLTPEDVLAFVDVSSLKTKGSYAHLKIVLPIRIILPRGIKLIAPETTECEVVLTSGMTE